ncbi:MAG: DUF429 domain-containing protein [Opitutus sp.]
MNPVIGIDVGGPKKGFHAVMLDGPRVLAKFRSSDPIELAQWCKDRRPEVVAIDAPCRWRRPGQSARAAERQLNSVCISCFSTPTEEKAQANAFYTWMLAGQALYQALAKHYTIYTGDDRRSSVVVETFPQAVACALAGQHVPAKEKFRRRRELLTVAGIDVGSLNGIDEVDAALCALTAQSFVAGRFKAYGDAVDGFIVVPSVIPPVGAGLSANTAPKPPRAQAPLVGREHSWAQAVGLFIMNFGHLDIAMTGIIEQYAATEKLTSVPSKTLSERIDLVRSLFAGKSEKQAAFARLESQLTEVREFRNILAHGFFHMTQRPDGEIVMGITQASDITRTFSPQTRCVTFEELLKYERRLIELIESLKDFSR